MNSAESNTPPQIPQVRPQFRTLDLVEAFIWGWTEHVGVSQHEFRILLWIAKRGKRNEPRMAFAWFPVLGQEWWAFLMNMKPVTLRTSLHKLRQKELLVNLSGSLKDGRYPTTKGYGIPLTVMTAAMEWAESRYWLLDPWAPLSLEECSTTEHPCDTVEHLRSTTEHPPILLEHRTPHSPTPPGPSRFPYPVDTQEDLPEKETRRLTSEIRPPGVSHSDPEVPMEDPGWAVPKDEVDTWSAPKYQPAGRTRKPTTMILDHFWDCWLAARESRVNLAMPWPNKVIPASNLKAWMKKDPDLEVETIIALVDQFFSWGVGLRGVTLNQETLWKDFWYARPKLWQRVRQRTPAAPVDYTARNAALRERHRHDSSS